VSHPTNGRTDRGPGSPHPPARVVAVVGPSGGGKTTLVEQLVAGLRASGYRVAAIKHDAHRLELDRPGKDSWRMRAAGADTVVLLGRGQVAWFGDQPDHHDLDAVVATLSEQVDVILIEGFRSACYPTVIVGAELDGRWQRPVDAMVLASLPAVDHQPDRDLEALLALVLGDAPLGSVVAAGGG
jgi:molybdopterin-guanine dinucleotide biosynthesis adapter protein